MKLTVLKMPIDEAFRVLCKENPTRDIMLHENGIAIRSGDAWQLCVSKLLNSDEFHVAIERVLQIGDKEMKSMYPSATIRYGKAS